MTPVNVYRSCLVIRRAAEPFVRNEQPTTGLVWPAPRNPLYVCERCG